MTKYSRFYAAYNSSVKAGNKNSKEETILTFTEGRTDSIRELSPQELDTLIKQLNTLSGQGQGSSVNGERADRMRKGIIAIFKKMGQQTKDAIAWAEKQGVKGQKKPFNAYSTQELYVLLQVADKVLADHRAAIRKSLSNV